jgi:hypothetical protein
MLRFQGHLDGFFDGAVVGWIAQIDLYSFQQVAVGIYAENSLLAEAMADTYRGDLLKAGIGLGNHGFRITLPNMMLQKLLDHGTVLSVRTLGSEVFELGSINIPEYALSGIENGRNRNQIQGHIDGFFDGQVTGWATQVGDPPSLNLSIGVYVKNQLIAQGNANVFRRDLLDAGIGRGDHGFSIQISDSMLRKIRSESVSLVLRTLGSEQFELGGLRIPESAFSVVAGNDVDMLQHQQLVVSIWQYSCLQTSRRFRN